MAWGGEGKKKREDISKGAKHMSTVRSAVQILPLSSLPFPNLFAELKHCAIMKGSKERCFSANFRGKLPFQATLPALFTERQY